MDENEVFENYHFIMVKRLLIVCIWPYQNKTLKFCGRTCVIFAVFTTLIPGMIKFYEDFCKDGRVLKIITENCSVDPYFQIILSKLGMNTYTAKKVFTIISIYTYLLQHLYEIITKDYNEIQEKTAMDGLRNFARFSTIFYASYMFTALFFYVFTPQMVPAILDVTWPLIESRHNMICYYAEYFIDQDSYLHILVLHTFVGVAISLTSVLNCRLKWLSKWVSSNINREEQRLCNFMIHTIKIHNRTLKFAELLRSTYDVHNFIIFGLSLLSMCFGSIDVMLNITEPEVIIRIGFVFVGIILYLFFVNWPGQRFLDSSSDLAGSTYSCRGYNFSPRTQIWMRFMMMRCLIPCQKIAGLLLQMNFAFCGSIMRKPVSFFMAVYSIN